MKKGMSVVVVGCFLLLAVSNFAKAQDDAMGPLKFSIGVDAAFTDNRDSTPSDIAESNTDIYIKPKVDAVFDWGDSVLDFFYIPSYRYRTDAGDYQDTSKLFHDLGLYGRHDFTDRLSVRAKETFKYTDDPTLASGGVNVTRDGTYFLNNLSGGVSVDVAPKSRLDFDALWYVKEFDESVFDYLNEESYNGDLAFRQELSRTVVVLAQVKGKKFSYGDITIDDSPTLANSDRDFSTIEGGVGVENQFSPDSKLSAYAGYTKLDFDEAKMDSLDSPYASIVLAHRANATTVLSASAQYGLRETAIRSYAAQKYSDIRGDISVDVSKSVILGAGGIYRYSKYDEDGLTPAGRQFAIDNNRSLDGTQTTVIGFCSAAYKLTEDALLKILYKYTTDDSDVSNDFDKNEVILSFVQNF